ncbi:MAG: hypothetical protein QOJ04_293, partial [Caballeronia sp.]|nr:hypothetical protein [Caballeronia sp.]
MGRAALFNRYVQPCQPCAVVRLACCDTLGYSTRTLSFHPFIRLRQYFLIKDR